MLPVTVLVQVYNIPGILGVSVITAVLPLQMTLAAAATVTVGCAFTVTVSVKGLPVHPFACGVMVYVMTAGVPVLFVNMSLMIAPAPFANPDAVPDVRAAVQLNALPAAEEVMPYPAEEPEHTCTLDALVILFTGKILTVALVCISAQAPVSAVLTSRIMVALPELISAAVG